MAVFEMPLHEMGSYKGSNPRPTDFDAYWQAALAEIQAVHADILRAQMNDQEYACPPDAPRIFLQLRQLG